MLAQGFLRVKGQAQINLFFSEMQAAVLRYTKWSENTMDTCWRIK